MTKGVGWVLILMGIFMGIFSMSQLTTDFWLSLFMLSVFSFGLYILGQRLRLPKSDFKKSLAKLIGAFVVGVVLAPGFLFYIENRSDLLEKMYDADRAFFFFRSGSVNHFALIILVYFVLIWLFGYKVFHGWKAGGRLLNGFLITLTIFFFGYQIVTFDSYSGIHKERGFVSKNWNEDENRIPFESIQEFKIDPFVDYGAVSNPSDETEFNWRLIIVPIDGEEFVYNTQSIAGNWLPKSKALQERAMHENIPFTILPMDDKTLKWYELDLKLAEVNRAPYDEFFEIK